MYGERRLGALVVLETASTKDSINRRLRSIDQHLFLEKQLTLEGEEVWCVCEEVGGDIGILTVFESRDKDGRPIPYPTDSIIEHVLRVGDRRARGLTARKLAYERNEELKAKKRAEVDEAYADNIKEFRRLIRKVPARSRPSALITGEFDQAMREAEARQAGR